MMKKILSLLLGLCLLLSLIGCNGSTPGESTSGSTTEPSSATSTGTAPNTEPATPAGPDSSTPPAVTEPTVADPQETQPPATEPSAPTVGLPDPTGPTGSPTAPDSTDPSNTNPAVTDPPSTRPSAADPAVTDPTAARPSATEPGVTDPPATRPPATKPVVTDPPATRPDATQPQTTVPSVTRPQSPAAPGPTQCAHRYTLIQAQAADCTAAEIRLYGCDKCGDSYQETVGDPLGHSLGDATCTTSAACVRCGITSGDPLGHKFNTRARCIRCGEVEPGPIELTISIRDTRNQPIAGVTVDIFIGSGKHPTATAVTGRDGLAHITINQLETYQVVLSDLPANVTANSSYTFASKQASINLHVQPVLDSMDHSLADYQKGSTMANFTLTDIDGNPYTLYDLLEKKELVILDFWYCTCAPCKSEFPYFETALDRYGSDISLLALNPLDSEDSIIALRQELGSTFPMLRDTVNLYKGFDVTAYPVTVFIDSNGKVLSIHRGAFSSQEQFLREIEKYLK